MAENVISTGALLEGISFYEMLTDVKDHISKIVIPKIQRDYAQGRTSAITIRNRFLASLFSAIDKPQGEMLILDFVFGRKDKKKNIFYPVDGQQRLTTLFLLYLYVGKRAETDEIEILEKFSYETRHSSEAFCGQLRSIDSTNFCGVKKYIEDQWWYTGLWRKDPTITAMINMLNDIDEHYAKLGYDKHQFGQVWENLKKYVRFMKLYLEDLDTTDDLYIKMNSRGKLLTDFEHFKALLDEYAHTGGRLSSKIDTSWTNLLWRYRNVDNDFSPSYVNNGLDGCFTNLLIVYLNMEGAKRGLIEFQKPDLDIINLADRVLGFHSDSAVERTEKQLKCLQLRKAVESRQIMRRFEQILDFFAKTDNSGNLVNDPSIFFDKFITGKYFQWQTNTPNILNSKDYRVFVEERANCDLLKEVCETGFRQWHNGQITLHREKSLFLEAFFEFAVSGGTITDSDFLDRIRVLRNLIKNAEVHNDEFKANAEEVDLLINTGRTYPNLRGDFTMLQKQQEKDKHLWMIANPTFIKTLKEIENHWLIMGNISPLRKLNLPNFDINPVILERFGQLFHSSCNYYLVEKALLTEGDYTPTTIQGAVKNYGGSNWRNWYQLTKSSNSNFPDKIQGFIQKYNKYSEWDLQTIIDNYAKSHGSEYSWLYYMIAYDEISNARNANYRYNGGRYNWYKLNANGGGRTEKFWNPYNLAIGFKLTKEIKNTVSEEGGSLILTEKQIEFDVREHTINIKYPDGHQYEQPIPYNPATGLDSVDRIVYGVGVCRRVFNTYNPPINTDEQTGEV